MKAKTKEAYKKAWNQHAFQFIHVYLDAGVQASEWDAMLAKLYAVIDAAADANFPEEEVAA